MFSDYYDVRGWLESFIPLVYGKEELGLERIENLLEKLGNPHKKFKSIHISGTAGKGSCAFYTARLLCNFKLEITNSKLETNKTDTNSKLQNNSNLDISASDLPTKVGLHISPHLNYIGERIQIQGKAISVKGLVSLMNEVRPVVEKIKKSTPALIPSYFEVLVAASFLHFAKERVDYAVVEVGLGGRLDATNVLKPEVCVITNVGLDHTEILGKTIKDITKEKAGIIKKGVPVVTGASGKALSVIKKIAKEKGSKVITIDTQKSEFSKYVEDKSTSGVLAVYTVRELLIKNHLSKTQEATFSESLLRKTFYKTFPGRFEVLRLCSGPMALRLTSFAQDKVTTVILDGAHSPDKMQSLIDFVREQLTMDALRSDLRAPSRSDLSKHGQRSIVLVLAFKKGKNWKEMVDLLMKEFLINTNSKFQIKKVIATKFYATTDMGPTPSQRLRGARKFQSVDPEEIAEYVKSVYGLRTTVYGNSQEAVFEALQSTVYSLQSTVLVTGSLYLVGEVRTMWKLPSFA